MVSPIELARAYSRSHLVVVSSRVEKANVSMLKEMICGLPVVATRCGAPETLIDENVGIAVRPNDPQALAQGILEVARNQHRYDRYDLRQFIIDQYSISAISKLVIAAYRDALSR